MATALPNILSDAELASLDPPALQQLLEELHAASEHLAKHKKRIQQLLGERNGTAAGVTYGAQCPHDTLESIGLSPAAYNALGRNGLCMRSIVRQLLPRTREELVRQLRLLGRRQAAIGQCALSEEQILAIVIEVEAALKAKGMSLQSGTVS